MREWCKCVQGCNCVCQSIQKKKTTFTSYHKKRSCYSIFTKVKSKEDMLQYAEWSECDLCIMCICVCGLSFLGSINNYQTSDITAQHKVQHTPSTKVSATSYLFWSFLKLHHFHFITQHQKPINNKTGREILSSN